MIVNREEIDDWLRYFSNHNHGFMSKDGKKITFFKVFQELKELQYLLEIKNDHIKELQQENKQLKDKLIEINEVINGYMPNQYAMCKAFDEIEFIISKGVE